MIPNTIHHGDCLQVMGGFEDECVELIYADPPFGTGRDFGDFQDKWEGGLDGYLAFMKPRLLEMRRVLKPTGSIYLHCDPTASHYLKVTMDGVFGHENFRNEIIWCYTGPGSPGMKQFSRKHDTILWYSMGKEWIFNRDSMRVPYKNPRQTLRRAMDAGRGISDAEVKRYRDRGKILEDYWTGIAIAPRSKQYLGYPTQKPLALLERIIQASSNKGDLILDPFCGSGTTLEAAHKLGRKWIGIDSSKVAVHDYAAPRMTK